MLLKIGFSDKLVKEPFSQNCIIIIDSHISLRQNFSSDSEFRLSMREHAAKRSVLARFAPVTLETRHAGLNGCLSCDEGKNGELCIMQLRKCLFAYQPGGQSNPLSDPFLDSQLSSLSAGRASRVTR